MICVVLASICCVGELDWTCEGIAVKGLFVWIVAVDSAVVVVMIVSVTVLVAGRIDDTDWIYERISVEVLAVCIVVDSDVLPITVVTIVSDNADVDWIFGGIAVDGFVVSAVKVAIELTAEVSVVVAAAAGCVVNAD